MPEKLQNVSDCSQSYCEYYPESKRTPDPWSRIEDLNSRAYSPSLGQRHADYDSDFDQQQVPGQNQTEMTEEEAEAIAAYEQYCMTERGKFAWAFEMKFLVDYIADFSSTRL